MLLIFITKNIEHNYYNIYYGQLLFINTININVFSLSRIITIILRERPPHHVLFYCKIPILPEKLLNQNETKLRHSVVDKIISVLYRRPLKKKNLNIVIKFLKTIF